MFKNLISQHLFNRIVLSRFSINAKPLTEQCWQCKQEINRLECPFYCPCSKHVLLPVQKDIDYFRLLDLTRSFEIDTKQLTRNFRNKIKYLHPDLYTKKSDIEKQYSQDQSARLNDAYKTLLSPFARAHYLLKLENITLEDSPVELPQDFLLRIMEVNEQLAGEMSSFPIDTAIEIRQEIDDHMKDLSQALNQMDLTKAKEILARLQYFNNINEKLTELELKYDII